jgi:hypothetical protein
VIPRLLFTPLYETVAYSYLANSPLVEQHLVRQQQHVTVMSTTKAHDYLEPAD